MVGESLEYLRSCFWLPECVK